MRQDLNFCADATSELIFFGRINRKNDLKSSVDRLLLAALHTCSRTRTNEVTPPTYQTDISLTDLFPRSFIFHCS